MWLKETERGEMGVITSLRVILHQRAGRQCVGRLLLLLVCGLQTAGVHSREPPCRDDGELRECIVACMY